MVDPLALTTDVCWQLVLGKVVGRIGFDVGRGPRIHPMNYAVDNETIVVRTSGDSELALFSELFSAGALVAFEVDHINFELQQGWSVLMSGHVAHIESRDELQRLRHGWSPRPWVDGERDHFVRITPVEITGRRIGRDESRPLSEP